MATCLLAPESRSQCGDRLWLFCVAVTIAALVLGDVVPNNRAQGGGPLLTVHADPLLVRPGGSVSFTVVANGAGSHAAIDVDVPNNLTLSQDVTCLHSKLYCEGSSVSILDADTSRLSITAPGAFPGPDGPRGTVRVTVAFSISIPVSVAPGTQFEIETNIDGLFNLYDPVSEVDKQVSTFVEVSDASGRCSKLAPSPTPTREPTVSTVSDGQLMAEIGLDPEAMAPEMHLVPGEHIRFRVVQGFREVIGFFTLAIRLPPELKLVDEPWCSVVSSGCSQPFVLDNIDGTTDITVLGYNSEFEQAVLDFTAGVTPIVSIGTSTEIVGRLTVTEASTGEVYEVETTVPIHFSDADLRLAEWEEEGTLRVTFDSERPVVDTGGCISLNETVRWGQRYFVCDNDSAAATPLMNDWVILTDTNPNVGEIVVSVVTGTYYVAVESLPSGFVQKPGKESDMVTVPSEGAEVPIESVSP